MRTGINRFAREIGLILGLLALVFWCMALLGFSLQDAAWSTSGQGALVHNWAGRLGAWIADLSYFSLGYSVWWCLAAGARAWLAIEDPAHPWPPLSAGKHSAGPFYL